MKPAAFNRIFLPCGVVLRVGLVAVVTLLVGASCAKPQATRGAASSPASSATGAYEFSLSTYQPGQRIATMLSRETARDLISGTGESRTDRASFSAKCEHELVALSGAQITKFDVQCKDVNGEASDQTLTGTWTLADGLQVESSNMGWQLRDNTRPAVLYVSPRALESLFGGVWQPGTTRQVPSSRQLWQLISPELSDVRDFRCRRPRHPHRLAIASHGPGRFKAGHGQGVAEGRKNHYTAAVRRHFAWTRR
ncbi:MAG: hypothetical protein IPL79_09720 [Myxococcales bacterium]|nr:hypothetical protein [Myxococcales bacterium]